MERIENELYNIIFYGGSQPSVSYGYIFVNSDTPDEGFVANRTSESDSVHSSLTKPVISKASDEHAIILSPRIEAEDQSTDLDVPVPDSSSLSARLECIHEVRQK